MTTDFATLTITSRAHTALGALPAGTIFTVTATFDGHSNIAFVGTDGDQAGATANHLIDTGRQDSVNITAWTPNSTTPLAWVTARDTHS